MSLQEYNTNYQRLQGQLATFDKTSSPISVSTILNHGNEPYLYVGSFCVILTLLLVLRLPFYCNNGNFVYKKVLMYTFVIYIPIFVGIFIYSKKLQVSS